MLWYNEIVKDHFQHPRNYGAMKNPDAVGEIGNKVCGDRVRLFLKLSSDRSTIENATFQVHGCPTAIASSSALTEMLQGISLDDAKNIKDIDISNSLGSLPADKLHCCTMAEKVLKAALVDAGKITGSEAEKIKYDSTFLSVSPGGTSEMLNGLSVDSKDEIGPMEKLQIIVRLADSLNIKIEDVDQSKKGIVVIKTSNSKTDELRSLVKRSLNDEIVVI